MCNLVDMIQSPVIDAARNFLNVVWDGEQPSDAALSVALDGLFSAYHNTQSVEALSSELEAPRQEGPLLYDEVGKRFPDYGLYPVCDPMEVYDATCLMADAIDDIADITTDMRQAVWLGEHIGVEHAHSTYRQLYFHWGQHARELSLYLHARQFR